MATYSRSPSTSHAAPYGQTAQISQRRHANKQRFVAELSQCLYDFVIQLLPTAEEMAIKEDVRKLLERLIRTIEPDSRLLSFGSTGNGFALRNSDMDLCCLIDSEERLSATDLVTILGGLLERETKFHVKPLPHARIPIVKLSLDPSPGLPSGIACDIGFENRLALENTRLLMCYAMVDPTRVRTMVLFLKVWSKRRKINEPYKGTLSSYGYVLLVIYFLVHVKNPPVLPNLQQIPPLRPIAKEDTHLNGYNVWFFDDIELLKQRWHSPNTESVAELLIDFFRYFSRDFSYNTGVASIRAGLVKKDLKGWQNEVSGSKFIDTRERNRFCIEDPFEVDFNVARCVTKDGLYTIRGEFMRALRILTNRPERAVMALAELCEERKDDELVPAPSVPPRLSTLPPQTPYTVGSSPLRPKGAPPERLSPPTKFFEPNVARPLTGKPVSIPPPPEHMAARRSKWTSPPPPEASPTDHTFFEAQLGKGIKLATASTAARETVPAGASSPGNSESLSDDEHRSDTAESDDVLSVRSFTEGSASSPTIHTGPWAVRLRSQECLVHASPISSRPSTETNRITARGRVSTRIPERLNETVPMIRPHISNDLSPLSRAELARRSLSGSPRSMNSFDRPGSSSAVALLTPLPPSPITPNYGHRLEAVTVYYQTPSTKAPRPLLLPPQPGTSSQSIITPQYSQHQVYNGPPIHDSFPSNAPLLYPRAAELSESDPARSGGLDTPTPASCSRMSHSHSRSTSTITAPRLLSGSASPTTRYKSKSRSPGPARLEQPLNAGESASDAPNSPSMLQDQDSPTTSSSGYSASLSRTPSPSPSPSPSPPPTAQAPVGFRIGDGDGGIQVRNVSLIDTSVDPPEVPQATSPGTALQSIAITASQFPT